MPLRKLLALLMLAGAVASAAAQAPASAPASAPAGTPLSQDLLNPSPRGLVEAPPASFPRGMAAPGTGAPAAPTLPAGPLPPDPALALKPLLFGSQLFSGRFASEAFSGFNPEYRIAVGDRVSVRMWGAFNFEAAQAVDAQGNIFIPNVGPVRVLGVRNADLNQQVESQVKRTFRASVGVYATLEAAQPVKVYVTGFVRAPGLYGGLSSDSVDRKSVV